MTNNDVDKSIDKAMKVANGTDDDILDALRDIFKDAGDEEIIATFEEFESLEKQLQEKGPTNPDELWDWLKNTLGIEATRYSVCEDHDAPFDVLCDMFFEDEFEWPHPQFGTRKYGGLGSILIMGSRGSGKTMNVALLHFLNSTFKPGCHSLTAGATYDQATRCYQHLLPWVTTVKENPRTGKRERTERDYIDMSQKSETRWIGVPDDTGIFHASKVEIVPGSERSLNAVHPNIAHIDEAEQMEDGPWNESRNLSISGHDAFGRSIRLRNIVTSTRKSKHGRMQQLIDQIKKDLSQGYIPSFILRQFCIFEVGKNVPNCQSASENEGRNPNELCNCHKMARGTWDDGSTRKFSDVCAGKLYKSQGFQSLEQIQELFRQNSRSVWEAQQECREPEVENNYIQGFRAARSVIHNYDPDPTLGPIFQGIDWGFANPNAITWAQYIYYDIEVQGFDHSWRTIPAGSIIVFDEIYKADLGASKLADLVIQREAAWKKIYPDWRVTARFADPQGRQQRADFKDKGLKTEWWSATRDVQTGIDLIIDMHEGTHFGDDSLIDDQGFLFISDSNEVQRLMGEDQACEMFLVEIEYWRKNPKTGKELQELNHLMSSFRYLLVNLEAGMGTKLRRVMSKSNVNRGGEKKQKLQHGTKRLNITKHGPLRLGGRKQSPVVEQFGLRP